MGERVTTGRDHVGIIGRLADQVAQRPGAHQGWPASSSQSTGMAVTSDG
jgi:hypothetical protein